MTPATTDPVVATIFASEANNYGLGVVYIVRIEDIIGIDLTAGNVLADLEAEVAVHLLPLDFARRASLMITAAEARHILSSMGISVPPFIAGPAAVGMALHLLPRLNRAQIGSVRAGSHRP